LFTGIDYEVLSYIAYHIQQKGFEHWE